MPQLAITFFEPHTTASRLDVLWTIDFYLYIYSLFVVHIFLGSNPFHFFYTAEGLQLKRIGICHKYLPTNTSPINTHFTRFVLYILISIANPFFTVGCTYRSFSWQMTNCQYVYILSVRNTNMY